MLDMQPFRFYSSNPVPWSFLYCFISETRQTKIWATTLCDVTHLLALPWTPMVHWTGAHNLWCILHTVHDFSTRVHPFFCRDATTFLQLGHLPVARSLCSHLHTLHSLHIGFSSFRRVRLRGFRSVHLHCFMRLILRCPGHLTLIVPRG
jgi:hypothetical protein